MECELRAISVLQWIKWDIIYAKVLCLLLYGAYLRIEYYVKLFKMTSSTPMPTPLTTLLLTNIKTLRVQLAELGYSQQEFQLYFLTQVLDCQPSSGVDASALLGKELRGLDSEDKVREVLGAIDRELQEIRCVGQDNDEGKRNAGEGAKGAEEVEERNKDYIKKRRSSKDQREKKSKKSKAEKRKASGAQPKQEANPNNPFRFLQPLPPNAPNLFNPLSFMSQPSSNIFKQVRTGLDMTTNWENREDVREEREKELILQKLIEIQMLSKLLCGERPELEGMGASFLMRC